jgi:hypothetical protein
MGDVQVVGYEVGGEFGTRVAAKLVSEFAEPLGRVVFGAELVVSGLCEKPETLVGPYFVVAVEGAEFPVGACGGDSDLVAVDLSNSRLRELPSDVFGRCTRLAAAAFPTELARIRSWCFQCCIALESVDLAATAVEQIDFEAFDKSGLKRVSLPASLRKLAVSAFVGTPLAALDLRASARISAGNYTQGRLEVTELGLPREGFAALAATVLPGSRIEVLYADVDMDDMERLVPLLDEWAIDRLRVVSPRLDEPFEWVRSPRPRSVVVSDPALITAPSAVTLTLWRRLPKDQLRFVRSIDLSTLGELPGSETVAGSFFLESVILPARLRVIPDGFFKRCPRLSHVGTSGCVALEKIAWCAFDGCRSLREFSFPSTIRTVGGAFAGTSIVCLDLSETRADRINVHDMKCLVRLVLPRCCTLGSASGLPALRSVAFGTCGRWLFSWSPRQVRFEGLVTRALGGLLTGGTSTFGEVACVLGRESFPFAP